MIVKKPYAIIAKYYKIINLLLLVPTVYLLLQMTEVASFFSGYVLADYSTQETNIVDIYLPTLTMIMPIAVAIGHMFIWIILKLKKKSNNYHLASAGYHILIFIGIIWFYTSMLHIEMGTMESTTSRFLKDISELVVIPLYVLLVAGAINVIGLNLKTLRFDKHQELRVTDEDEEEIEVKVANDSYDAKRRIVHYLRELKYYVAENKIIIGIIIACIGVMVVFKAFLNYQVYNQSLDSNQSFSFDGFELSVKESYITKVDYRGSLITKDRHYLAVKIGIHNQGEPTQIEESIFKIKLGDTLLLPTYEKSNRFIDVGKAYNGEIIYTDQADDYVFVYELKSNQVQEYYEMRILNNLRSEKKELVASYTTVDLNPINLTKMEKHEPNKLDEKIDLSSTTLKNTTYTLNGIKVVTHYDYVYEVCNGPNSCYKNRDTIVPTGGKLLMIIDDEIEYDKSSSYYEYPEKNFYQDFITVEYTFDILSGKNSGPTTKIGNVVDVTPKSLEDLKIYEVPYNIMNAYKLNVLLTVRNQIFTIKVKE